MKTASRVGETVCYLVKHTEFIDTYTCSESTGECAPFDRLRALFSIVFTCNL